MLCCCGLSRLTPTVLLFDQITDEGASALGAVLAGRMGLRSVDLRGNKISKQVRGHSGERLA